MIAANSYLQLLQLSTRPQSSNKHAVYTMLGGDLTSSACMQPEHFTYVIALRLRGKGVDGAGIRVPAQEPFLSNPARIANHIKTMYWFFLGYGPYLGRWFGGQLPIDLMKEGAWLDAGAMNSHAELAPGMRHVLQGVTPMCINVLHRNDIRFDKQNDVHVETEAMPLSGAYAPLLEQLDGAGYRQSWCARVGVHAMTADKWSCLQAICMAVCASAC